MNDCPKDTNRHNFAERQTERPEFYGLGLHSARRQAGVSVGIGILGCNGSRYRKVLRSSCRYLPYIAMKNDLVAAERGDEGRPPKEE